MNVCVDASVSEKNAASIIRAKVLKMKKYDSSKHWYPRTSRQDGTIQNETWTSYLLHKEI
jgi:hypothetical protein